MRTRTGSMLLGAALACAACEGPAPTTPAEATPAASASASGAERGAVADADRTDGADTSVRGIAGRLASVGRVLGALGERMDAIGARFIPPDPVIPPDPILPDFRTVLADVRAGAEGVAGVARFLEADVCGLPAERPAPLAAADGTVAEADRTDDGDASAEGLLGRLGSVHNVLAAVAKRMDDIAGGVPPDDISPGAACVPEVLGPLAEIRSAAAHVAAVAAEIDLMLAAPREEG